MGKFGLLLVPTSGHTDCHLQKLQFIHSDVASNGQKNPNKLIGLWRRNNHKPLKITSKIKTKLIIRK